MAHKVNWLGNAVLARAEAAAIAGVGEGVRAAAAHARANHPWRDETGAEAASVWSTAPRVEGPIVKAFWGAHHPAFFLEVGTVHMPAFPWLRRAGDAVYPGVVGLIRASLI